MGDWRRKQFNEGWTLVQYRGNFSSFYISVPREVDSIAIVKKLKTLPGATIVITDATFDGYDIFFRCTTPFKELFGELKQLLEIPDRYVCRERKRGRTVRQYTLDGVFVAEYNSVVEASEKTNIGKSSISNCATGKNKSAGNFIWKYAR